MPIVSEGPDQSESPRKLRVMIVEDHDQLRAALRRVLEDNEGLTVVADAASVAEAVEFGGLAAPDVLLMDLHLPDGTGLEAWQRLRPKIPAAHLVILTSTDDAATRAAAIAAGACVYLVKPARRNELLAAIERCRPAR